MQSSDAGKAAELAAIRHRVLSDREAQVCRACDGPKRRGFLVCVDCYSRLPSSQKTAIVARHGIDRLAPIYFEAVCWLLNNPLVIYSVDWARYLTPDEVAARRGR